MKKALFIVKPIILISAALVLAACQSTPGEAAVVKKGGGELEAKVMQTRQSGEAAAPPEGRIAWNETRSVDIDIDDMGNYTVAVNMDVLIPLIPEKIPAYLIEPKEFSEDFMKKASGYLMKGEIFDGKESKEDVMKELLDFKKDLSAHTVLDGYQKNVDAYLDFMDERYEDAADGNGEPRFEYNDEEYGQRWFYIKSYPEDNSIMEFSSFCGTDGFYFRVNDLNRSFRYLSYTSGENVQANGTKATYKEALAEADKAMAALFEEPFAMVHSDITDIINDNEYLWNHGKETSEGQAYVFYYTREYGGIPSLFIKSAPSWVGDETEYAKPYPREGLCVVVDGRGIVDMLYQSYSGTVKALNDNIILMPFNEVLGRFKDEVFYHSLWGLGGSTIEINITRIEFGMVREPLEGNPDQYMMVPAWNFIGNLGNTVSNEYGSCEEKSILALSAIDGSIITDYDEFCDPK